MTLSQNGYVALSSTNDIRIHKWIVDDAERHFFLLRGSPGFLLTHWASWYDENIERLDLGVWDEWGFANRLVRGSTSVVSNHGSATAIDVNATRHPLGVDPYRTLTNAQVLSIRKRLRYYEGAIRWGGDYNGRKDPMHYEVDQPIGDCEQIARKVMRTQRGKAILAVNPGQKAVILS